MSSVISGFILRSDATPYLTAPKVSLRQVQPQGVENTLGQDALLLPGISENPTNSAGFLSLTLFSESDGTAYEFRVTAGDTPNQYDSGWFTVKLFAGQNYVWDEILPTTVPDIRPDLDRSVARVAQQISSDPSLSQLLRSAIGLTPRGEYSPTVTYRQGDLVGFSGGGFTPILPTPITGIDPTIPGYWQTVGARGLPGGTGGNNSDYVESAWLADSTDAPTRRAVGQQIVRIDDALDNRLQTDNIGVQGVSGTVVFQTVRADTSVPISTGNATDVPNIGAIRAWAVPRENPVMEGTVQVPLKPISDDSRHAASTEWVRQYTANYWQTIGRPRLIRPEANLLIFGALTQNTSGTHVLGAISSSTLNFSHQTEEFVTHGSGVLTITPAITNLFPFSNYRFLVEVAIDATANNFSSQNSTFNSIQMEQSFAAASFTSLGGSSYGHAFAAGFQGFQLRRMVSVNLTASQIIAGYRLRCLVGTQGAGAGVSYVVNQLWSIRCVFAN